MAQEKKKKHVLKRAFNSVKGAYKNVHDAVEDRLVQWTHGSHAKNLEKMIDRLAALPGGKDLLAMAEESGVQISVVTPGDIDGAKGRFSRSAKRRIVRVANNGDIDLMTATLWHELRHVEQHISRGDMKGNSTRLVDTRMQHTFSLMHEADAFTNQFVMAIRQEAAGNPDYLDKMLARDGTASAVARDFLRDNPYKKYDSEAQMARALFTEIMLRGLTGYNARYLEGYHDAFEDAETLDDFRALIVNRRIYGMPDDEQLTKLYGQKYMASTSLQAIATAFLHAQPPEVYDTLLLIEKTADRALKMSEDEYQDARDEIMARTKSLSKAFNKSALKHPQQARKELRAAARAPRPFRDGSGGGVRMAA